MLRLGCRFCRVGMAATVAKRFYTLDDAYRKAQATWNIDFAGGPATTNVLSFRTGNQPTEPVFHIMDLDGGVSFDQAAVCSLGEENIISRPLAEKILRTMLEHETMDKVLLEAQRHGRISFYMTMFGEEALVAGAAAGLAAQDELFLQYRESSVLTFRGYSIKEFVAQCMGNRECEHKGRQMPIHFGCEKLHVQAVSSPLGTQISHGAGAGYAIRLENEKLLQTLPSGTELHNVPDARICATFFGEGAASEGDFQAGLNIARSMGSQTLFIVRNNGYAISTPTKEQYGGDGICGRAHGYGISTARVDGTDALAVYHTVRKARELILRHNHPILLEALTYRLGHHSTSDESTAYRTQDEMRWFAETFNPIKRFEKFMVDHGWWSSDESNNLRERTKKEVLSELRRQEKLPLWPVETMCDDVVEKMTPHLKQQKAALMEHYAQHKVEYEQEKL